MKDGIEKPTEPTSLQSALTEFVARQEPNSRLSNLGLDMLRAHSRNRERRDAVLAHEDLRQRLVKELGYAKPEQWNGFIPVAMWNLGDDTPCRSAYTGSHGEIRFQYGQIGKRALGEMPNDSPRRKVLLEVSQEAWDRARHAITKENPNA